VSRVSISSVVLLTLAVPALADGPAAQTRPWRIAVAGGYSTDISGSWPCTACPGADQRYRIVRCEPPSAVRRDHYRYGSNSAAAAQAMEQFAAAGGTVLWRGRRPLPRRPSRAAASRRTLAPTCSLCLLAAPSARVCPNWARFLCRLRGRGDRPDEKAPVTILAGTLTTRPLRNSANHLRDGGRRTCHPAGSLWQGYIVYCANCLSVSLSLSGRAFEPFVCRVLDVLSGSQLRDRVFPANLEQSSLLSTPPPLPEAPDYPRRPEAGLCHRACSNLRSPHDCRTSASEAYCRPVAKRGCCWATGRWRDTDLVFSGEKLTLTRSQGGRTLGQKAFPCPRPRARCS